MSIFFLRLDSTLDSCIAIEGDTAAESTTCTPVVGRMKAHYTGDEETIRAYLLSNIEMEMNSNRVRIEDVEDCRFVGDRDAWQAANFREGMNSKNTGTNLAVVVSVVVGVMVVGLALLVARGRRRRTGTGACPTTRGGAGRVAGGSGSGRPRTAMRRGSRAALRRARPRTRDP